MRFEKFIKKENNYAGKYGPERKLLFFFIKLLLIWISWKGIFYLLGEEKTPIEKRIFPTLSFYWEKLNYLTAKMLLSASESVLKTMGYTTHVTERSIWIENIHAVGVGNYCLGFQLIYYNTLLILISYGPNRLKIIGILFGIVITQLLNIIRIVGLSILVLKKPEWVIFFHDHVFNFLVFGIMILFYYKFISGYNEYSIDEKRRAD